MSATNQIGLENKKALALTDKLNDLLANFHIYYQNIRGFHWNIKGADFFQLHPKFEQLYTDALVSIDEIAERILTLGGKPRHAFSSFLETAAIKEVKDVSDSQATVKATVSNLTSLITMEREILTVASEASDEGTIALISEYIKNHEKEVWMLNAWLNK